MTEHLSENLYETLVEASLDAISVMDLNGILRFCNKRKAEMLGFDHPDELIGTNGLDCLERRDRVIAARLLKEILKKDILTDLEFIMVRKDGSKFPAEFNAALLRDKNGEPQQVMNIFRDISERKKAVAELRESEVRLRQIIDLVPHFIFAKDKEGKYILANNAVAQAYGITARELVGRKDVEFTDQVGCVDRYLKEDKEVIESGKSIFIPDAESHFSDGSVHRLHTTKIPFSTPGTKDPAVLGVAVDITELRRSEKIQDVIYRIAKLVDTTDTLEDLYKGAHSAVAELMPADNFYIALFDEKESLLSFPYFVDESESDVSSYKAGKGLTEYILRTGESLLCDIKMQEKLELNGEIELVGSPAPIWMGVPLKDDERTFGVMVAQHYHDPDIYTNRELEILEFVSSEVSRVIVKKRAEATLLESEQKYRSIIENSLEGIFVVQNQKIRFSNQMFAEMFGYKSPEEIVGIEVQSLICPDEIERVMTKTAFNEEEDVPISHFHFIACKADRTEFEVETLCSLISYEGSPAIQGVVRDVSDRRRLEAQLRQAQKMEAIGRLAGGVAHDFNNILTIINSSTELALLKLDADDPMKPNFREIKNATNRAATLVRQLLAFSRKQTFELKVLNLNEVLLSMDMMLKRIIGENIRLDCKTGKNLWNVKLDAGQIEQVILNMAINARDAMPAGGNLSIETSNTFLKSGDLWLGSNIEEGNYVKLSVKDDGVGMSVDVKNQIFDPFYTTKAVGKGTGLGLATVYGIVKQSDGYITVNTEINQGTVFDLYFPRTKEDLESINVDFESMELDKGRETILLVEDEAAVLEIVAATLRLYGYSVIEAESGEDGYEKFIEQADKIDMVVTDVRMPGINGPELIERLRKIRSDLKALFISGYAFEAVSNDGISISTENYLQKPFNATNLNLKIKQILGK